MDSIEQMEYVEHYCNNGRWHTNAPLDLLLHRVVVAARVVRTEVEAHSTIFTVFFSTFAARYARRWCYRWRR